MMSRLAVWVMLSVLVVVACGSDVAQSKGVGDACRTSGECGEGLFCELGGLYPSCNDTAEAVCAPRPDTCDGATPYPVCGCDGNVYESPCEAQRAGTNPEGDDCTPPPDLASCGNTFCDPTTSLCATVGDAGQRCHSLPSTCDGTVDCDCLGSDWACDGFGDSSYMSCDEGESLLFVHCGF